MASAPFESFDLSAVPLFPLPNVVLFPGAVLPLHIFEERYKAMTADALRGDGQIAMALLKAGWEKNYYQQAAIEPVVCTGRILSHEKLADGRYNFLLEGVFRARIVREFGSKPYRVVQLEALRETSILEVDLEDARRRLTAIFEEEPLASSGIGCQFRRLLRSPLPTARIADLTAFNFLEDISLRQQLLAETDVRRRVDRTLKALAAAVSSFVPASTASARNPGLN
jgi:ATP-dependent Lon protease